MINFFTGLLAGIILWLPFSIIKRCSHEWEYLGTWGITFQQKKCKKCGKLKIEDQ